MPTNKYIEHILELYRQKKIPQDAALSLLEKQREENSKEPIAVIGISCRMPQAPTKEAFWKVLQQGIDCIRSFPATRRKDTDPLIPSLAHQLTSKDKPYWKGGFLDEVDLFDNEYFRILPAEAKIMDPQQRLFLELAVEAFEDAGITAANLKGTATGVFIGDVVNEYQKLVTEVSPSAVVGNISPFIASRVSYFYDLHGPTVNVSTTCSTSLVAVHSACQSLVLGECEMALVGAVNLRLFPFALKDDPVDALGITTDQGACLAFDERADGIVRGEGAVALVLKRMSDAIRDQDFIYAEILGSAVNNDGKSSSVGAPNPLAQAELLKSTWKAGHINPRKISYIEAHGTGTRIGDPIEIQGMTKAFSEFTQDKQFCAIGSVKTNIGHLTGGAAGIAGLLKTILALQNRQIPPTIHFEHPNALIDFPDTPVYVANQLLSWPAPRIAGVSAFGFNGTNCHVVVRQGPEIQSNQSLEELPFIFSHRSSHGLQSQITKFIDFLSSSDHSLENISYTLCHGRDRHPVTACFIASSKQELLDKIHQNQTSPIPSHETLGRLTGRKVPLPTYIFDQKRFWLEGGWKEIASLPSVAHENRSSLKDEVLHIFQDVMGIEQLTFSDHFFNLGGDSLLGVEIIHQIHQRLQKKITYQDLFQHPQISTLADFLEQKTESRFESIPKHSPQEWHPLSFGQRRLWILHQMQENPIAYNMYDTYRFDVPIDLSRFQQSLDFLVQRHASFCTLFSEIDGEPVQRIVDPTSFDLKVLDLSEQAANEAIECFRRTPFDLSHGPLAKALLIRVSPTSSIFFFMIHHIISDGWSIRVMIQELLQLYEQGKKNPPLSIDVVDYCHWQKNRSLLPDHEAFWGETCQKPLPICEIPGDKPRPALFHFEGKRQTFFLSVDKQKALSQIATNENATLFMALLSSVYTLIHSYTGQRDLIIGSPIAGRVHPDLKPLIGFFVNTLVLRCAFNPEISFQSLLADTRKITAEAFEHQDYPFDLLVDQLNLDRDTSRSPLFNINVAFQNFELSLDAQAALASMKAQRIEIPHHSCKWDLEFEFIKQEDGSILCYLEYYTGIYSEEMISLLIQSYTSLLDAILQKPEAPLKTLLTTPASSHIQGELRQLRNVSLPALFEEQVSITPNAAAIKCPSGILSYDELNQRSNQLSHFLLSVTNNSLIGIYLGNGIEAIIAIWGILKSGHAYVPLDPKAPLDRTRTILKESGIDHIISLKQHLKTLDELQWSGAIRSFLCLDTFSLEEEDSSHLMNDDLWNQVANESTDAISASGWVSSYTGLLFSEKEMEEFAQNILKKTKHLFHPNCKVLEIGCGSGFSAFTLAPFVGSYTGIDISSVIIQKNRQKAKELGLTHLRFECLMAHNLESLNDTGFDLIIINSVIHCFPHLHYLKSVLHKAIVLMKETAHLFLGDLMDLDLKKELENSMRIFKETHRLDGYRTKTEWNQELFLSRNFLRCLPADIPGLQNPVFSRKIGTIENELTQFRFDALFSVNRQKPLDRINQKEQFCLANLCQYPIDNLSLSIAPDSLAYVLFTSGSTGQPKGVMVEHRSVQNYIQWAIAYYSKGHLDFLYYSPLTFDLTVTSIFAPLFSGGSLSFFPGEFDQILDAVQGCNIIKCTPTHLTLISERGLSLPSVSQFIVGGEALYAGQAMALTELFAKPIAIYNEYGPTEATVGCIIHEWNVHETDGAVLIGTPIFNTFIHIVDEYFRPVPVGGIGEIMIGGASLARGYLNRPELDREKFIKDPLSGQSVYRTGDLGRLMPNGKIAYLGRKDRQVKVKGFRIELDEIEAKMSEHPAVHQCSVVVREDQERGKFLVGYFVGSLPAEELAQYLSEKLPQYMVPLFLVSLPELPMSKNGKIDPSRLPPPEAPHDRQIIAPANVTEKSLLSIWSRVLGIPEKELSMEDSFFDLGGDSIIAMRILPQVKKLGFSLSIQEIFQYKTLRAISQKTKSIPEIAHPQDPITGEAPLSPIQMWFWEQNQPNPNFFTMAYLFEVPPNVNVERLEEAFKRCISYHDALRLTIQEGKQRIASPEEISFQIQEFVLESAEQIESYALDLQKGLDLAHPPLIKAALFDLRKAGKRLYLCIHHLLVDGVSWRFLVEDLIHLYSSALEWMPPPKTASIIQAVRSLAVSEKDIAPWLAIEAQNFLPLFNSELPKIGDIEERLIHLTQEKTNQLSTLCCPRFQVNINDILLASLTYCLSDTFGRDSFLIHHEGHGRNLPVDVSRTIGWFTTIFPIILEKKETLLKTLIETRDRLSLFAEKDVAYSTARYLQKNPRLTQLKPEILLNYFGKVDRELEQGIFKNAEESIGQTSDTQNRLPHFIEMNAIVVENRLRISVMCTRHMMQNLRLERLEKSLDDFIDLAQKDLAQSSK